MACVRWPLRKRRPAIEVDIVVPGTDRAYRKHLLADTGAGSLDAPFELLLDEEDCILVARRVGHLVGLGGAYSGEHRTYVVEVRIPALEFSRLTMAVGIERPPLDFDGIAGFRFLNRFTYGNLGQPDEFGLEL